MTAFQHYLLAKYPQSKSLGCYNNRSVRGGHATSLHAVSRAFDWSYGSDRAIADEVFEWLTGPSGVGHILGVQAVHDYHKREHNGSHWGSHSARAWSWGHNQGGHWSHVGPGDTWLHIELNRDAASDPHLMNRIGHNDPVHTHPAVHVEPKHEEHAVHADWPKHTLHKGMARSHDVKTMQVGLRAAHRGNHRVSDPGNPDGIFGRRTKNSLASWQRMVGLHADGIFGRHTEAKWIETWSGLAAQ